MSIQEVHSSAPPKYQLPSPGAGSALTIIDTVNEQALITFIEGSDNPQTLEEENALLKRQLAQVQVSTYQDSLGIIRHLTEQNKQLLQEKEALARMLVAEQDKFTQLKKLAQPALTHVLEDVTQNLVTKLMKRVPNLNEILLNATKENGTMNFDLLIVKLEELSAREKSHVIEDDDDLYEWTDLGSVDLGKAFQDPSKPQQLLLTYGETESTDKQIVPRIEHVTELKTVIIPSAKESEFDQLIEQLKLLKDTFGDSPSFHAVVTEEYIIIDGEKLDKDGAMTTLLQYMGMLGKGVCVAGKSTFWMMGTVIQLASFVGLGISIFASPWTAAFLLLGRFSYPILRLAAGI